MEEGERLRSERAREERKRSTHHRLLAFFRYKERREKEVRERYSSNFESSVAGVEQDEERPRCGAQQVSQQSRWGSEEREQRRRVAEVRCGVPRRGEERGRFG